MSILVTGGNGFVGSYLVDRLNSNSIGSVVVLDGQERKFDTAPAGVVQIRREMADPTDIHSILVERNVDTIYHLAWTPDNEKAVEKPVWYTMSNLSASIALLEACKDSPVTRFIYLSSGGAVYGLPEHLPIQESHPTQPINLYGVTKLAVEKAIHAYSHLYGLPYVIFRSSPVYGPRQNLNARQGAISVFIHHALMGLPITIWGSGDYARDFLYVEDLVDALVYPVLRSSIPKLVYNLSGGCCISLQTLVQRIGTILGKPNLPIRYESARRMDVPLIELDISAAAEDLHWVPKWKIETGIESTAEWIRAVIEKRI